MYRIRLRTAGSGQVETIDTFRADEKRDAWDAFKNYRLAYATSLNNGSQQIWMEKNHDNTLKKERTRRWVRC